MAKRKNAEAPQQGSFRMERALERHRRKTKCVEALRRIGRAS